MPAPCEAAPPTTYQLHVLLRDVEPAIWRRLHIRSDTTLTALHVLLQIAFAWRGWSSHEFLIRGKRYGRGALPESAQLSQFGEHNDVWGAHAAANPGYHCSKSGRSVPSSARVRVCSSR